MTPEEKAKELIGKFEDVDDCDKHFYDRYSPCSHQAKQCASICVEQILEATIDRLDDTCEAPFTGYWMQVLEIIKNS